MAKAKISDSERARKNLYENLILVSKYSGLNGEDMRDQLRGLVDYFSEVGVSRRHTAEYNEKNTSSNWRVANCDYLVNVVMALSKVKTNNFNFFEQGKKLINLVSFIHHKDADPSMFTGFVLQELAESNFIKTESDLVEGATIVNNSRGVNSERVFYSRLTSALEKGEFSSLEELAKYNIPFKDY